MITPGEYKVISDALSYAIEESTEMANDMLNIYNDLFGDDLTVGENSSQMLLNKISALKDTFTATLNKSKIDKIIVSMQQHVIVHFGPVNDFLSAYGIKVRQDFATESDSLGYTIDPGNIEP